MDLKTLMRWLRSGRAVSTPIQINTTVTPYAPRSEHRAALVLVSDTTLRFTYATDAGQLADRRGILVNPGTNPIILDWLHHGTLVTSEWYALAVGGVATTTLIEVFRDPF